MRIVRTMSALGVLLVASTAASNSYPAKPITIIVPTAPAGSTDIVARLVAPPLQQALGQTVIVENRAGASGNIGTEAVARATPDGHTLLMQYSGYHVGNPALFAQIKWHPTKDFAPVALAMRAPHVLAVRNDLPVKTINELASYAKQSKKGLFYASSGNGSIQHIAGELLAKQINTPITHVPFKGSGPAINDLLAGQVDIFVTTPPSVIGHIGAGKMKALAYTGPKRHPAMPNVPTSAEAGLPGYEVESWFGLFAPTKTPAPVIARLTAEMKKIVEGDAFRRKMDEQGAFASYMEPAAFAKFIDQELALWAKVVKDGNIRAD